MMKKNNYVIEGVKGFDCDQFYKALKTKYKLYNVFNRENPNFPEDLRENIREFWNNIEELTFKECVLEKNNEKKRVLFSAFGPENILKSIKSELVDDQTITKDNYKVNELGKIEKYVLKDNYKLHKFKTSELGIQINRFSSKEEFLSIVECNCTTTGRKYFLFVPNNYKDSIEAISSTIRIPFYTMDHNHIEHLYRHGDVIMLKMKDSFKEKPLINILYPISKDIYLEKLIWQS